MRTPLSFEVEPFEFYPESDELERSSVRRSTPRRPSAKIRLPRFGSPKRSWPFRHPRSRPPTVVFPPPFGGVETRWPPVGDQPSTEPATSGAPLSSAGGAGGDISQSAPVQTCQPPLTLNDFADGSAQLVRNHHVTLAKLAESLNRAPLTGYFLIVEGHAGTSPREKSVRALAVQRAMAVAKFLVDRGLDIETVIRSRKGNELMASNVTLKDRQHNRSVVIRMCRRH